MARRKKTDPIRFKWVGDGNAMIQGVPTRDLTAEESAEHADRITATQENTGIIMYELVANTVTEDEE